MAMLLFKEVWQTHARTHVESCRMLLPKIGRWEAESALQWAMFQPTTSACQTLRSRPVAQISALHCSVFCHAADLFCLTCVLTLPEKTCAVIPGSCGLGHSSLQGSPHPQSRSHVVMHVMQCACTLSGRLPGQNN